MKKLYFLSIFMCVLVSAQINVSTLTAAFNGSGGLTIDADGNVYIADFGDFLGGPDTDGIPNNVMKLDTDLNLTVFANDFTGASGNEFDSNGILYQADIRDNAVYRIVNGSRELYASSGIIAPVGIAFDSNDNLFVCNCGNNTIRKITPEGTSTLFSSSNLFACPNGMTVDENDNLYVVNFSNSFIVKLTPDGTATNIGSTNAGNGHIDYDENTNNLYIASFGGNQIHYLNIETLETDVIAGTGVAGNDDGNALSSTFSAPNGIAVSDDGDSIYINSSVTLNNANLNPQYVRVLTGVINFFLSVDEINSPNNSIKTYPNPTADLITIESKLIDDISKMSIEILDINGRVIKTITDFDYSEPFKLKINTTKLQSGIYFYSVIKETKNVFQGKFIKK